MKSVHNQIFISNLKDVFTNVLKSTGVNRPMKLIQRVRIVLSDIGNFWEKLPGKGDTDFLNSQLEYSFTKKFPQSIGVWEKILGADNFWGPLGHKTEPEISFNMETINFRATECIINL